MISASNSIELMSPENKTSCRESLRCARRKHIPADRRQEILKRAGRRNLIFDRLYRDSTGRDGEQPIQSRVDLTLAKAPQSVLSP
jgi:hypothetical protein